MCIRDRRRRARREREREEAAGEANRRPPLPKLDASLEGSEALRGVAGLHPAEQVALGAVLERFEAEFVRLSGEGVALAVKFPKSKRLAKR